MSETPPFDPTKPPWDTRIPGVHPALLKDPKTDKLTATEDEIAAALKFQEEAKALNENREAGAWQRFYNEARHKEQHARLNLASALKYKEPKDKVILYRRVMVMALLEQGRFADAKRELDKGRPGSQFKDLRKKVREWHLADSRPNDEDCGCEREIATIEVSPAREAQIELHRHSVVGAFFSERQGTVVEVHRCRHCGHLNAYSGKPPGQARIHEIRAEARRLSPQQIKAGLPAHYADRQLLQPKTNGSSTVQS